ncbi:uncharacterized protein METZ01_LOCUS513858, partial [marine metagenome]
MPSFLIKSLFLFGITFSLGLGCGGSDQNSTPVQGNAANTEPNNQSNNDGAASPDDSNSPDSNDDSSDNN